MGYTKAGFSWNNIFYIQRNPLLVCSGTVQVGGRGWGAYKQVIITRNLQYMYLLFLKEINHLEQSLVFHLWH